VTSVEAGFKGRFLDGRAYFSMAAYHLDIKNYQDSFYNSTARAFQVRSLDAKSTGMEMEGQFKLADWLTAYGNMAWNPKCQAGEWGTDAALAALHVHPGHALQRAAVG
jgi:outer membrane receptor protein involved in Fe transport